jgi:hypothetical protein
MFAGYMLLLLVFVGFLFAIYKFVIEPRIPDKPKVPKHVEILQDKLKRLQEMKGELVSAKEEKEVTEELKDLDSEISHLIKEITEIENA